MRLTGVAAIAIAVACAWACAACSAGVETLDGGARPFDGGFAQGDAGFAEADVGATRPDGSTSPCTYEIHPLDLPQGIVSRTFTLDGTKIHWLARDERGNGTSLASFDVWSGATAPIALGEDLAPTALDVVEGRAIVVGREVRIVDVATGAVERVLGPGGMSGMPSLVEPLVERPRRMLAGPTAAWISFRGPVFFDGTQVIDLPNPYDWNAIHNVWTDPIVDGDAIYWAQRLREGPGRVLRWRAGMTSDVSDPSRQAGDFHAAAGHVAWMEDGALRHDGLGPSGSGACGEPFVSADRFAFSCERMMVVTEGMHTTITREEPGRAGGVRLTPNGRVVYLRVLDGCAGLAQIAVVPPGGAAETLTDLHIDTQCAGHQYEPPALHANDTVIAWASYRPTSGGYAILRCGL